MLEFILTIMLISDTGDTIEWKERFHSKYACEMRKVARENTHQRQGLDNWDQVLSDCVPQVITG